ncbi:MAG: hypothetical protein K6A30_07540 [Lachnospiraceae bacterium]|nr:hypothetical protein [Lachnospiraceae bacterium]
MDKTKHGTYEGHKYEVYANGMTWKQAKTMCEELGGHLVTITSSKEQKYVKSLLDYSGTMNYWLGAKKKSGKFNAWITGEDMSYTKYATGEPSGNGSYLMMYAYNNPNTTGNDKGKWNDIKNTGVYNKESWFGLKNFGFICEYENEKGHVHSYENPIFHWNSDKSCTATFTCACGKTKDRKCTVTKKVVKRATLKSNGKATYTPRVTYKGKTYTGEGKTFTTYKASKVSIADDGYHYTGGEVYLGLSVKDSKNTLIKKENYDVTFVKDNKQVEAPVDKGDYKIKIKFKNLYSGSKSLGFSIYENKTVEQRLNHLIKVWKGFYFTTTGEPATYNMDPLTKNTAVASGEYFHKRMGFSFVSEKAAAAVFPYYKTNGGTGYPTGWTCAGFGTFAEWYIGSGGNMSKAVTTTATAVNVDNTYEGVKDYIQVGDLIRYGTASSKSSHSAIVVSIDETSGIKVLDANYTSLSKIVTGKKTDYNYVDVHDIPYSNQGGYYTKLTINHIQ